MTRILFFDLATATGWAFGSGGRVEAFGHFELPRTGEDVGAFLCAAESRIGEILGRAKADLIGFEAPFLNRRIDTILKIRKLGGLANEVEKAACKRRTPCQEALVDDVRRHFLGRAYPRARAQAKIAVKVRCRDLGWDVATDDEGDAVAGLSFMFACQSPKAALATTPLFQKKPRRKRAA